MTAFLLVTGSRMLPADGYLPRTLDRLSAEIDDDLMLLHGQCDPRHPTTHRVIRWDRAESCSLHPDRLLGADWQAHRWAASTGVPEDPYPADWDRFGRAAGPLRNQRMVDVLDGVRWRLVVAFPAGSSAGTMDCVRRPKAAGIPVRVYEQGAST